MQTTLGAKRLWQLPELWVEGEGDPGRLPGGEDAWLMSEGMSSAEGQGIRKAGYFRVMEQHV